MYKRIALIFIGYLFFLLPTTWSQTIVEVGRIKGSYHEIMVEGNFVYCASDTGLAIIDVSEPNDPSLVGFSRIRFPDDYGYIEDIFVINGIAYITSKNRLYICDVHNPFNPIVLDSLDLYFPTDVYCNDKYLYVTFLNDSLRIFDVIDPHQLRQVGKCKILESPSGIYVVDEYAYVVEEGWGTEALYIINVSDPTSPIIEGELREFISPRAVYVHNSYAYLTFGFPDIQMVDVNSPTSPVIIGSLGVGGVDVFILGNLAFIAGINSLHIFDVSNPCSPIRIDSYNSFSPRSVWAVNNFVYLTDSEEGLRIFEYSSTGIVNDKILSDITPMDFRLEQNYPNPFNNVTRIKYQLNKPAEVTILIIDITGREVKRLIERKHNTGTYEVTWDGRDNRNLEVHSGLYLCTIQVGDKVFKKKLMLMK